MNDFLIETYKKLLALEGERALCLKLSPLQLAGSKTIEHWFQFWNLYAVELEILNYDPDWLSYKGVSYQEKCKWGSLLNRSVKLSDHRAFLNSKVFLDPAFYSLWNESNCLILNESGSFVAGLSPGIITCKFLVDEVDFEKIRVGLPMIAPISGTLFAGKDNNFARKHLSKNNAAGEINAILTKEGFYFKSSYSNLLQWIEKLYPDNWLKANAEDICIESWVAKIEKSKESDSLKCAESICSGR